MLDPLSSESIVLTGPDAERGTPPALACIRERKRLVAIGDAERDNSLSSGATVPWGRRDLPLTGRERAPHCAVRVLDATRHGLEDTTHGPGTRQATGNG